jgi:hypothetical protein
MADPNVLQAIWSLKWTGNDKLFLTYYGWRAWLRSSNEMSREFSQQISASWLAGDLLEGVLSREITDSPFGTSATNLPIVPALDGSCSWMWGSRWNENWQTKAKYSEKTCPSATLSPQIPHDLTWARTRSAEVGSRRLTAWAVARPIRDLSGFWRVLTMVYNTQNYCVFELCPTSDILKARKHVVSETGCFRRQVRAETPTPLSPLERTNLNHWTVSTF